MMDKHGVLGSTIPLSWCGDLWRLMVLSDTKQWKFNKSLTHLVVEYVTSLSKLGLFVNFIQALKKMETL